MSARWRQKNYVEYVREHFGLDDPGHGGKATFDPTAAGYRAYPREHRAVAPPAPEIRLSADPQFRGDAGLMNPEQLLVMAAAPVSCCPFSPWPPSGESTSSATRTRPTRTCPRLIRRCG